MGPASTRGRDGFAVPLLLWAAVCWAAFQASCASPSENGTSETGAVATWSGGEVTEEELDAMLRELPPARRQPAPGQAPAAWLEELVADLVLPRALLARARDSELGADPALRLRVRYLASQEVGRDYLRRRCPREEVSEAELMEVFERTRLREPRPWILVRHIYKRSLPGAPAEERRAARRALEELAAELDAGASFVELARRHSDSETAGEGGLIGRLSRQAPIEKPVLDAAWALADGEVSGAVEVANGFHLLLRVESGIEAPRSFDESRPDLHEAVVRERQEACGRQVLAELASRTPAIIDRGADEPADVMVTLGEEQFTLAQLDGLAEEGSLLTTPRPGVLVRHFVEALLLAAAAGAEDPETAVRHAAAAEAALRRLLGEAQWRAERRRLVGSRSEDELRAYFESHRERFRTDLELDVGLILLGAGDASGARAAMERAQAVYERIRAGAGFAELAREVSEHSSRDQGGRLGPMPLPRLRVILGSRGIVRAAELSPGEVSEPVAIVDAPRAAYGVLELYGRNPPRPRTFEEARDEVVAALAQDRIRELDAELRRQLLDEIELRVDPRALEAYLER
jgi:hypothetical protein